MRRVNLGAVALVISFVVAAAAFVYAQSTGLEPAARPLLERGTATPVDPRRLSDVIALSLDAAVRNTLQHPAFPLIGGHAGVVCADCHRDGLYLGTPTECVACHREDDVHQGANGLDCAACHNLEAWTGALFDHSRIGDTDCSACHTPPPDHFGPPCAACHQDTGNFRNAGFDHSRVGGQDCSACHTPPPDHFGPPCAACHQDVANFRNAGFDHSRVGGQDCSACHTPPPDHFGPPCAACHQDVANFRNAGFDHSRVGGQDCSACHAPPPDHFPGRCRDCHQDTGNFRNARFDHAFPLNHGEANGQCAACHTDNSYSGYTCFNCHERQEMIEEHADKDIFDIDNCLECHPAGRKAD